MWWQLSMDKQMADVQAWGKTERGAEPVSSHHLAHHSADVAFVFWGLLKQPVFRRRAETALGRSLTEAEVECLAALAFLHDIGKLAPVFQAKGWTWEHRLTPLGHLQCGYLWLIRLDPTTALDGTLLLLCHWPELPKCQCQRFGHPHKTIEADK